jgi:hypothetical protein
MSLTTTGPDRMENNMEEMRQDRCGWCKTGMQGNPEFIIAETKVPIEFERQFIEKIIFLSLREKPPYSYASIFRDEEEYEHKEVPVFVLPCGEDEKNIAIKTCSKECAEAVANALKKEEFIYEWNFER